MANPQISTKRLAIGKANAQIVGVVAAASFITIFCLVASNAVWSQNKYQARVTKAKSEAHAQLQKNIKSFNSLATAYNGFISTPTNAIGGNTTGTGDNDGNNAKIILDALPSSYDFPALTASIEKVLHDKNFTVSSINGIDDQLAQATNTSSPTPTAAPMEFSFTVTNTNYAAIQDLISRLQSSIRPIQIDSMVISGGANNMQLTVKAHTYYQPGKSLTITKKVVK